MTIILDQFPTTEEFYATYWGQKPFVVRGGIDTELFNHLIDGDTLAGLALEEDIKSRLVITAPDGDGFSCEYGPFDEDRFAGLGELNWSLLVQNVEQFHTDTAKLLEAFHFTPRWLMDDIMVSYSAKGGSVGPHTDSYHVFLVQGMGKRRWKISHAPVVDAALRDNDEIRVLRDDFAGDTVEVSIGDIIYMPPHFAHEGITIEDAMTFSVGFLGPQISEIMIEYAHYLEEHSALNTRYVGMGLDARSGGFTIDPSARDAARAPLLDAIGSEHFSRWMAEFFSTPTHNEIEEIECAAGAEFDGLAGGATLYKPQHIKLSIVGNTLAVFGEVIDNVPTPLLNALNQNTVISQQSLEAMGGDMDALLDIIKQLYQRGVLIYADT